MVITNNIDVLIDLAGHTGYNSLPVFALRAAPVQLSWLGYPNTTGLKNMDFRIVDNISDPEPSADNLATEKLIRINPSFLCYSPYGDPSSYKFEPKSLDDPITFACFNNLSKISNHTIDAWTEIFKSLKSAKLLIKCRFAQEKDTKQYIIEKFLKRGMPESSLKVILVLKEYGDHLEFHNNVDIALDPFPYNGTTTSCESLMMGVPVITRVGDRHASRVGMSILSCINHQEFIAQDTNEYISKAISFASDKDRLKTIKHAVRNDMLQSPLMDGPKFAQKFQDAIYSMIHQVI